jgi:hypothetical protein
LGIDVAQLASGSSFIIVAWLMVRYAKANSLILGYTIFFSLTVSGALVVGYASMYNDSWLFLTETQIAIYITFALLTVWHWKHAAICFVGSVLLCGSIFVFHSPTLWVAWVQKWLIITPVGVGMVIIIWMRYRGIYENFHITQALKASTADLAAQNANINASIDYAQRIQQALLPSEENIAEVLPQSVVFYRPRDVVSGDFY